MAAGCAWCYKAAVPSPHTYPTQGEQFGSSLYNGSVDSPAVRARASRAEAKAVPLWCKIGPAASPPPRPSLRLVVADRIYFNVPHSLALRWLFFGKHSHLNLLATYPSVPLRPRVGAAEPTTSDEHSHEQEPQDRQDAPKRRKGLYQADQERARPEREREEQQHQQNDRVNSKLRREQYDQEKPVLGKYVQEKEQYERWLKLEQQQRLGKQQKEQQHEKQLKLEQQKEKQEHSKQQLEQQEQQEQKGQQLEPQRGKDRPPALHHRMPSKLSAQAPTFTPQENPFSSAVKSFSPTVKSFSPITSESRPGAKSFPPEFKPGAVAHVPSTPRMDTTSGDPGFRGLKSQKVLSEVFENEYKPIDVNSTIRTSKLPELSSLEEATLQDREVDMGPKPQELEGENNFTREPCRKVSGPAFVEFTTAK